ncbi:response regulator [Almyronema epifaneia]|uniref:histidine kinase n=1 Tax=Almyronema epifaneia S1 TaxID=2991925 RepID=A0ABW6IGE4_9CYAN
MPQTLTPKGDILVVDDRADNLRLLSHLLNEQGYKVRKVIKGELVFDVIQVNPPDLILLDIIMPQMNGFEICQRLKADPNTQDIPIIFLSALDEPLDKVKAFSIGGADYITKPFEIQEVVARIEHQLNIIRLQNQLKQQNWQLQQEVQERHKAEKALQQLNQDLETRVQQRTAELTTANQQLQRLEGQLRQSLAQEQELSAFKSRIITTISHEYRTPLAIISSSAGVLEEYREKLTEQLQLKHLGRIQHSVQHLTQLVNDVLFLEQTDFGQIDFNPQPLALLPFCQALVEEVQLASPHHTHRIEFSHQGDCPLATWDGRVLKKTFVHLLNNAIKYSPASSVVHFRLRCWAESVEFQVQDAGIGIPTIDQASLFESFWRASNVGNLPGVGLGLSIVKKCVERQQGAIAFESQEGVGTTFTVRLPICPVEPASIESSSILPEAES